MQKATFLIPVVVLVGALTLLPSRNEAADPAKPAATKPPAPKSGVPQIYEKEESGKSFTDVVKVVRPSEDSIEVLFEKHQGVHHVSRSEAMLRDLRKSQKDKTPVSVKVDDEDRILSVTLRKSAAPPEDDYDEKDLQKLMKSINKN